MTRTVAPVSSSIRHDVLTETTRESYRSELPVKTPTNGAFKTSAFIASFLLIAAIFAVVLFAPTEHDRQSFFSICVDKHRRLEQTPSPRVILTGGSNVTLGVDTALLEEKLRRPVVSLSSNILMGLGYQLKETEDSLKKGDIIVVIPEYENWIGSFNGGEAQMMMPALLPQSVGWLMPGYLYPKADLERFGKNAFSSMKERLQRLLQIKPQAGVSSFHIGKDFNERCDYVGHLDLPRKQFDLTEKGAPDLRNYDLDGIRKFNKFAKAAKEKGAIVILLPPVTTRSYAAAKREQLDVLWKSLKSKINCVVFTDYENYALLDNLFWDCKYHPQRVGRHMRTSAVAADLLTVLDQSEVTRQ